MALINYIYEKLDDFQTKLFLELHIKSLKKIIEVKDSIISNQEVEQGVMRSEYDELMHEYNELAKGSPTAQKIANQRELIKNLNVALRNKKLKTSKALESFNKRYNG